MRRGQYPNPTFLNKAEGIKKERHTKFVVGTAAVVLIALTAIFIRIGANMQKLYEQEYPELVGAATATTSETQPAPETEPLPIGVETYETEVTEPQEIILAPVIATETTVETIDLTDLSAQVFEEEEPFHFRTSYPLQTVSHEQRDVLLDYLKQDIQNYIASCTGERICFRYVNLHNSETTGINDLEPIVPAGAFALPIEMTYWYRVSKGFGSPNYVITYDGSYVPGNSSVVASFYPPGKMFYLRTLANLAITENDSYALSVVLSRCSGIDNVWNHISLISGYINYTEDTTYTDYQGTLMCGPGRTSCYDMAAYARELYFSYIRDAETYQPLINDLYYTAIPSAYVISFNEDASVLHVTGRNETFHAYTDIAIIDASEPIVLIVYCECASLERAQIIEADISGYVARYLEACHAS